MKGTGLADIHDTKMDDYPCPQSVFNLPRMTGMKRTTTIFCVTNLLFKL